MKIPHFQRTLFLVFLSDSCSTTLTRAHVLRWRRFSSLFFLSPVFALFFLFIRVNKGQYILSVLRFSVFLLLMFFFVINEFCFYFDFSVQSAHEPMSSGHVQHVKTICCCCRRCPSSSSLFVLCFYRFLICTHDFTNQPSSSSQGKKCTAITGW